jgi:hypothetical protein
VLLYKLRHTGIKRRTVYRSEQEPTWQVFKIHTQMLQHKAAFKKEAAGKKIIIILNT